MHNTLEKLMHDSCLNAAQATIKYDSFYEIY